MDTVMVVITLSTGRQICLTEKEYYELKSYFVRDTIAKKITVTINNSGTTLVLPEAICTALQKAGIP
jgi:hypothetical protein